MINSKSVRFKDAWIYCTILGAEDMWREAGKAALENMELDFGNVSILF